MKRFTVILFTIVLGFALLSSPSVSEARGGHGGGGGGGFYGGHKSKEEEKGKRPGDLRLGSAIFLKNYWNGNDRYQILVEIEKGAGIRK